MRRWIGILLGLFGAFLVLLPKLGGSDAIPPAAIIACLAAMISITAGTIWQKHTGAFGDLRTTAAIQFMGGVLVVLPLAAVSEKLQMTINPQMIIAWAWGVLGLSVGANLLLLTMIRHGAVAGVASLLYLVPPVSAVMAFLIYGDVLVPIQIGGMVVATGGVVLANRSPARV
jgi:drug/metabolite transporter (DMT)-like permease